MKKITIAHPRTSTVVSPLFHFNYPEGQLSDFEEVEIIPVDEEGKQVCKSEIRTVVLVGQPNEKGIAQYEASIHKKL